MSCKYSIPKCYFHSFYYIRTFQSFNNFLSISNIPFGIFKLFYYKNKHLSLDICKDNDVIGTTTWFFHLHLEEISSKIFALSINCSFEFLSKAFHQKVLKWKENWKKDRTAHHIQWQMKKIEIEIFYQFIISSLSIWSKKVNWFCVELVFQHFSSTRLEKWWFCHF